MRSRLRTARASSSRSTTPRRGHRQNAAIDSRPSTQFRRWRQQAGGLRVCRCGGVRIALPDGIGERGPSSRSRRNVGQRRWARPWWTDRARHLQIVCTTGSMTSHARGGSTSGGSLFDAVAPEDPAVSSAGPRNVGSRARTTASSTVVDTSGVGALSKEPADVGPVSFAVPAATHPAAPMSSPSTAAQSAAPDRHALVPRRPGEETDAEYSSARSLICSASGQRLAGEALASSIRPPESARVRELRQGSAHPPRDSSLSRVPGCPRAAHGPARRRPRRARSRPRSPAFGRFPTGCRPSMDAMTRPDQLLRPRQIAVSLGADRQRWSITASLASSPRFAEEGETLLPQLLGRRVLARDIAAPPYARSAFAHARWDRSLRPIEQRHRTSAFPRVVGSPRTA
jgi:hypothetical protein